MAFTLQDLLNAGLPAISTDGNNGSAATVFSRTLTQPEVQTYMSIANAPEYRKGLARIDAAAIPNWATWTQAQWTTYYQNNINGTQINAIANLADAKAVMLKMSAVIDAQAKMLIALRNYTRIIE